MVLKLLTLVVFLKPSQIFTDDIDLVVSDVTLCQEPAPSPNTYRITNQTSYYEGGIILYDCFMNHRRKNGSHLIQCNNGHYTDSPLQCELYCGKPKNIPGTSIIYGTRGFFEGGIVRYICLLDSNIEMNATCDANIGGWLYQPFDCKVKFKWDGGQANETSDGNKSTVFVSDRSLRPSWTRFAPADDTQYSIQEVRFALGDFEGPNYITVTVLSPDGQPQLCFTKRAPFDPGNNYTGYYCASPLIGNGVNITATFTSENVLTLAEVDIIGNEIKDIGECGVPQVLYGASANIDFEIEPEGLASYYCLSNFKFINKYSGPSVSKCLSNDSWYPIDNICAKDEKSPKQLYPEGVECLYSSNGEEYIGKMNYTISGKNCLPWTGSPNADMLYFPDNVFLDETTNYCRNPSGLKEKPWCFVDEYLNKELCPIAECSAICSMYKDNYDYKGTLNRASNGDLCARWDSIYLKTTSYFVPQAFPDNRRDHNYCRNPARSQETAWCYIYKNSTFQHTNCYIPPCSTLVPEDVFSSNLLANYQWEILSSYYWRNGQFVSALKYQNMNYSSFYPLCNNMVPFILTYINRTLRITDVSPYNVATREQKWFRIVMDCDKPNSTTNSLESPTNSSTPITSSKYFSTAPTTRTISSTVKASSMGSTSPKSQTTDSRYNLTTKGSVKEGEISVSPQGLSTTQGLSESTSKDIGFTNPAPTNNSNDVSTTVITMSTESHLVTDAYNATKTVTTITSSDFETTTPVSLSNSTSMLPKHKYCACSCIKDNTPHQVQERMKQVKKELLVEKSTLSVNIRKQTSAIDNRPSAKTMGYTGILMLVMTFAIIIFPDLVNMMKYVTNILTHRKLLPSK